MAAKAKRVRRPDGNHEGLWRRGRWWFIGGGVTGAIALLAALSISLSGPETAIGEMAPDIALATAAGEIQLSERRGETLLLYFSFPG